MLKMYHTLFIHESETASKEEKALAEKKFRRRFFSSPSDEIGQTGTEDDVAAKFVDGTCSIPVENTSFTSPDNVKYFRRVDCSDFPHIRGGTEAAEESL
jgi:hypothetical protein